MKNSYGIIVSLLQTEKGSNLLQFNKYLFRVDRNANKLEIKRAVEEIFKVKVADVNVLTVLGKKKRLKYKEGRTPDWKKAIVTLKAGEKIETA